MKRKSPGYWMCFDNLKNEALKYENRNDFCKYSKGAYMRAQRDKVLDDICSHMKDPVTVKQNTQKFIDKAKKVHGDKYDYSKTDYVKSQQDVIIICSLHGEFSQTPATHLKGCGCKDCGYEKNSKFHPLKKSENEFYANAKKVHGDFYDYSKVNYTLTQNEVEIICPNHGPFFMTPYQHTNCGQGCQSCGWERSANKQRHTIDEFTNKANKVHFFKFDYSKVIYKKSSEPVNIICKEHGIFTQRPVDHLNGQGCPTCKESKGEKFIRFILEKNNIVFESQKKFDKCTNNKQGSSKRKLPFDFYLPDYNVIIEFDGAQHYRPVSIFGGQKAFERRLILDQLKNDFCFQNNIKIIRILDTLNKDEIEPYIINYLNK